MAHVLTRRLRGGSGLAEIQRQGQLFGMQIGKLMVIGLAAIGVGIIEWIVPSFFNYPYFKWGGWESVGYFWPFFAWGVVLHIVLWSVFPQAIMRADHNQRLLLWQVATSTMAGIWEELGYRCFFICYAMLIILFVNWVFSSGIGWVGTGCALFFAFLLWRDGEKKLAMVVASTGILTTLIALYANPVYWLYQLVVFVIHLTTFFQMDSVLYGPHDPLFVFGAIAANGWFRDGHKYQGTIGLANSWYAGMIFLYATVTYGLGTAIVVHVLYNIVIHVLRFFDQNE